MSAGRPLATALLAAVALTLGLGVGEIVLRAYEALHSGFAETMRRRDPLAVKIEPHGEHGYRQKPGAVFRYRDGSTASANAQGFRGPSVATPKAEGTFRIGLFGGSTTHGWGVPDDSTIDAAMRRLLAERYPDRRIEVLNLAFDGHDSYQVYERVRTDADRFQLDAVIVNSGINDVANARWPNLVDRDPRTLYYRNVLERLRHEQKEGRSLWTLIKHYSYLVRAGGVVRDIQLQRRRASAAAAGPASDTLTPHPEAIDYFERNLRRVADLTHSRGIPLLLSTPPSSLPTRYRPGDTSYHVYWIRDAATTQLVRDQLAERLVRVAEDLRDNGVGVGVVPHALPPEAFLDDCHLTPEGNRRMADDFVTALVDWLDRAPAARSGGPPVSATAH